jgi:hypothetical protein
MGDRANVRMKYDTDDQPIYLYTHWTGTELPATVQRALKRKLRWNDGAYLARIIFDEMTRGVQGQETGFGIAPFVCDNEHPVIEVDVALQRVAFYNYSWETRQIDPTPFYVASFETYVKLPLEHLTAHYESA